MCSVERPCESAGTTGSNLLGIFVGNFGLSKLNFLPEFIIDDPEIRNLLRNPLL
jgi:hypothetical protein